MNFFKHRREQLGKTQLEIAIALDMTPVTIGNWERGDSIPDLSLATKLAKAYDVDDARIEKEIVALHRQRRESLATSAA